MNRQTKLFLAHFTFPALFAVAGFGDVVPEVVKIPEQDWSIGKYEVTQKEYESVMGTNPSHFVGENLPVESITWIEAIEFCKKLTERERKAGRISENYKYTLPTSGQWEYACRAGTTTPYYTGSSRADLARAGWYIKNSGGTTHPVGRKVPNDFNLYDMHGNVWEWCFDAPVEDRICRGGSWGDYMVGCEVSIECTHTPGFRSYFIGFRVALVPEEK